MDSFEHALPAGTLIDERYRIDSVLGEGGFAITYKAFDTRLQCDVAIKEFLPNDLAARSLDTKTVQPRTNRNDDYSFGLNKFLDEARTLASLRHPHIVQVTNFIKANGTGYLVMAYDEGQELGEWLKTQPGKLSEEAILGIITPILEGLTEVHEQGLLHRDIKPGNIFLRQKGGPMLIDFGAARQAVGEKSKSISAIISQGYAPPEQYTTRGKQGAFTDLYAIGATLYRLIIGQTPVEASDRSHAKAEDEPDPMLPTTEAGKGKVSDWLLQLTDQLLAISPKQRPQSAEAVLEAIKNKTTATIDAAGAAPAVQAGNNKTRVVKDEERFSKPAKKKPARKTSSKPGNKSGLYAGIAAAVLVVIGTSVYFSQQPTDVVSDNNNIQVAVTENPDVKLTQEVVNADEPGAEAKLDAQGLLELGTKYYYGRGVEKNVVEAIRLYLMAAEKGDEDFINKVARMFSQGYGAPRDVDISNRVYQMNYIPTGPAEQRALVYQHLKKVWALKFERANDVERNYAEEMRWYYKAAEQGDIYTQFKMAQAYRFGKGVKKDNVEAVRWYRKAAEQGYARAANDLGKMYEKGWGVTKNKSEAIRWFRKAAELGDWDSQKKLKDMGVSFVQKAADTKEERKVREAEAVRQDAGQADIAAGPERKWKMATTFPKDFPVLGEQANQLALQLGKSSNIDIKVFAARELVGAFEVFDAVKQGKVQAGWAHSYFWKGKIAGLEFLTSYPDLPGNELIEWSRSAESQEFRNKNYHEHNIHGIACGANDQEGEFWLKQALHGANDLQGRKIRLSGLQGDVYAALGAIHVNLPGGEIHNALQSGVIDGANWSSPYLDLNFGLHESAKNYYYPSLFERTQILDLMINLDAWKKLAPVEQQQIQSACKENLLTGWRESKLKAETALDALKAKGIAVRPLPASIQNKARAAWKKIKQDRSAESRLTKELFEMYDRRK